MLESVSLALDLILIEFILFMLLVELEQFLSLCLHLFNYNFLLRYDSLQELVLVLQNLLVIFKL